MKKIAALLLSVLILLSVVGCTFGSSSSDPSGNNSLPLVDGSDLSSSHTSSEGNSKKPTSSNSTSTESNNGTVNSNSQSSDITTSNTVVSNTTSDNTTSGSDGNFSNPGTGVNPENYLCYSALSTDEKTIYNALLSASNKMESSWIDITVGGKVTSREISLVFHSLETDHPELFWLPSQYYIKFAANKVSFLFVGEDIDNTPESSTYLIKKSQKDSMVASLRAEVEEIKSLVTATDPYEIELQLHDILCERVKYSSSETNDPMLWTAYGALVNGLAVCEGYSRAYQLLLYEFGINATLATGVANGEGHMWNIVNINGSNYHVDVTWDDNEETIPFHIYFNLTDSEITATHTIHADFSLIKDSEFESDHALNYNFNLPSCRNSALNYFKVTGKTFNKGDEETLADYIITVGDSVEIKYLLNEPDLTKVNGILDRKGSKLSIKSKFSKPPSSIIILEVK